MAQNLHCVGLSIADYYFLYFAAVTTIIMAVLRLTVEILQMRHPVGYLLDWVNWLEIPLYLCSIIFVFVFATPCLCVYHWQWQFGSHSGYHRHRNGGPCPSPLADSDRYITSFTVPAPQPNLIPSLHLASSTLVHVCKRNMTSPKFPRIVAILVGI